MEPNKILLESFIKEFNAAKSRIANLKDSYSKEQFEKNPAPGKWSAAECITHMNISNAGYIENTRTSYTNNDKSQNSTKEFKPRFLISKFINMMKPGNKMKFKSPKTFIGRYDGNLNETISTFIKIQDQFIELAEEAKEYDLKKVKVVSPASSMLKFQLGEMFMATIEHQKRHLVQAEKALQQ